MDHNLGAPGDVRHLTAYPGIMAEFEIVDLSYEGEGVPQGARSSAGGSVTGQSAGGEHLGTIDTAVVAAELEALRNDLASHVQDNGSGLRLSEVTIKLSVGAEGKVAFIAKGTAEASIEVKFTSRPSAGK